MTAAEKGELLDAPLTVQPALRAQAEQLAMRRLATVDPAEVADEVESDLGASRKLQSVSALVREATGIWVRSLDDLKRAHFASLRTGDRDQIRSTVAGGAAKQNVAVP